MVLENFIRPVTGTVEVLHFSDHEIVARSIKDPATGRQKIRNVLVFQVDERNGKASNTEYSFTSEKGASQFAAFLADKSYVNYLWTITPRGSEFQREYEIRKDLIKRP